MTGADDRRRRAALFVVAIVASVVAWLPRLGAAGEAARPRTLVSQDGAFGYRVEEERRYVLGPPGALRPGESATWAIRLERVMGEGSEQRAVFVLEHKREEARAEFLDMSRARLLAVQVDAELTVDPHGFPLRLLITERQDMSGEYGSHSDERTTTYTYEDQQFNKHVRVSETDWNFRVPIARHDSLDLEVPEGLYLFLPSALYCMGSNYADPERSCRGIEPAFANPGLINLAMPRVWEDEEGRRELLFFMATGAGTQPAGLMNIRRWAQRERDGQNSIRRYYERTTFEIRDIESVEVGPRTMEAWRVSASGPMRDFWVDRDGRVVRVDLDPHPRTGRSRWIRMQFPSEY